MTQGPGFTCLLMPLIGWQLEGIQNLPAFRKAIHYLIRNQDKSGKFFGYLHTTWIATGVFLMMGERYATIAVQGNPGIIGK